MPLPQWTSQELDRSVLEISDEVLAERIARVEPLYHRDGVLYRFRQLPDLRNISFTWGPKDENLIEVHQRFDDETGKTLDWYVEVERGATQHSCGYHGIVKPSIAEVLAQLPDNPRITAFYLDVGSARILYEGEGHLINVFWLSNLPETHEDRRARYARRHPGEENIYD